MAQPTSETARQVKRLARYLHDHTVLELRYPWQRMPLGTTVLTDSDWVGCRKTRRSIYGGAIVLGCHLLKRWSRTQAWVALSSAEAELVSMVKGCAELIGVRDMMEELGHTLQAVFYSDSSAARGIVSRSGGGRLKHIETNLLWIQEHAARGSIHFRRVVRKENGADILIHLCTAAELAVHIKSLGARTS